MKDQYFGDVNDYRKYGLLRVLADVSGLRVGVCWLRTANDARSDGGKLAYLGEARMAAHDPELHACLARLLAGEAPRSVALARHGRLVPGAVWYEPELTDDPGQRERWFAGALVALRDCPLVFFDPDNGFEVRSVPPGRRGSCKYLRWSEAEAAWARGHSLLVYQHWPRRARLAYAAELATTARTRLPGAHVHAFHTAHVLFLLAAQPEHAERFAGAPAAVHARWPRQVAAR